MVSELKNNLSTALIVSAPLGAVGFLGGSTLQWIVPTVVPAAHALVLGVAAPASMAMYALANKINSEGGPLNMIFSLLAGYVASVGITNMLGFSVSVVAPFMGLTALAVLTMLVCAVTIPIVLTLGCCIGCAMPAAPQQTVG